MPPNNLSVDLENLTIKELKKLTKDSNTSAETLRQIYWIFKDWRVLADIVDNPNVNLTLLSLIAPDNDPFVRAAVAENSRCTSDILHYLSTDNTPLVRHRVWRNPNTNEEDLVMIKAMRWMERQ